jgi:hypothetical protein
MEMTSRAPKGAEKHFNTEKDSTQKKIQDRKHRKRFNTEAQRLTEYKHREELWDNSSSNNHRDPCVQKGSSL